ncbi:hypothetical protein [Oryzomonas rubra]|uniref:Lipoprotein n=1 Tax=Oryzomonas rubra TaxID=2509454 RepID=A0A5A9XNU5_9BACT|nr:hypothetical protein [Oryzomonas rubra]KAA0894263.1 hypothetical protein ET418_04740 [Oryzomonas rubra]
MKSLAVILMCIFVLGCSKPYRTGSVCVEPFLTSNYSTSDPIVVKQDIVDAIEPHMRKEILKQILKGTKLQTKSECTSVEYILSGNIVSVDTGSVQRNMFAGQRYSSQNYTIEVAGTLKSVKSNSDVTKFNVSSSGSLIDSSLRKTLEEIGYFIAEEIKQ